MSFSKLRRDFQTGGFIWNNSSLTHELKLGSSITGLKLCENQSQVVSTNLNCQSWCWLCYIIFVKIAK